jgi:hypothetical protein
MATMGRLRTDEGVSTDGGTLSFVRARHGFAVAAAAIASACSSFGSTPDDTSRDGGIEASVEAGDAAATYASIVIADQPAAFFELESNADLVTKSSVGDVTCKINSDGVTVVAGLSDPTQHAFHFDGLAGYLDCTHVFDFDGSSPYTIEAWVSVDINPGDQNYRHVIAHDDQTMDPLRQEWSLVVHGGEGFKFERIVDGDDNGSVVQAIGDQQVGNGVVHHVVGVYDDAHVVRMWIDGVAGPQKQSAVAAKPKTTAMFIGATDANGGFFRGTIDDVAIYAKALPEDRIKAHWDARAH